MNAKIRCLMGTVAIAVAFVPGTSHASLPHGCVAFASTFSVSADAARRSLALQSNTNQPCTFLYSPGDVFSGSGEYKIECATGGVATDSLQQGPQMLVPIPLPCDPGALVTVHSGHTGQGGAVVAGSTAFVVGTGMPVRGPASVPPSRTAANTYTVRYIAAGWQGALPANEPSPVDSLAPTGGYQIVPVGRSVTVSIADDLAPHGSFLFSICQRNAAQPGDYHCGYGHDDVTTGDICYTGPTTLSGVVPGNPVDVYIWEATTPCPDSATTGTLTVVG